LVRHHFKHALLLWALAGPEDAAAADLAATRLRDAEHALTVWQGAQSARVAAAAALAAQRASLSSTLEGLCATRLAAQEVLKKAEETAAGLPHADVIKAENELRSARADLEAALRGVASAKRADDDASERVKAAEAAVARVANSVAESNGTLSSLHKAAADSIEAVIAAARAANEERRKYLMSAVNQGLPL
jgi:chromosome segregation ATPase